VSGASGGLANHGVPGGLNTGVGGLDEGGASSA
jgi:hypothetical protein